MSKGIPSSFAIPFAEPAGIMPIGISVSNRHSATNFSVPSPPTAITLEALDCLIVFLSWSIVHPEDNSYISKLFGYCSKWSDIILL
ncbi:hypothetical protein D3C79_1022710 [compost metagenome]